jgi:iron-sulfur cluster assembly protein
MIEVTETAQDQIAEYFKDKDVQPIRIFLQEGGWGGPSLAMALDEQRPSDYVMEQGGFQFIVDNAFLEKAKPIKVDFHQMGFMVTSSIELSSGGGCSGCGTDSSCGTNWL